MRIAMAKARQCDRCGEFYREYGTKGNKDNPNRIKIVCSNYRQSVFDIPDFVCDDKDLCPRCMKELKAFLNIDKEENQDSEKKPLIQKLELPFCCMDEDGNTDREIVKKVNEIIDVLNEYK